jgi:hypothetical protein
LTTCANITKLFLHQTCRVEISKSFKAGLFLWVKSSDLYFKRFTIVNYASVWSVSYNRNLRSKLRLNLNYDRSFIVLATVITIINYDRKTFIVQATDHRTGLPAKNGLAYFGVKKLYTIDSRSIYWNSLSKEKEKKGTKQE